MTTLFGGPSVPATPPPPPVAPGLATQSVMQAGMAERQRNAAAAGSGQSGTNVTGDKAVAPDTTAKKSTLGG